MYTEKTFPALRGAEGFPDALLDLHFTLYAGYVKNTNALLAALREAQPGTPAFAELHRRFGWEFNGMRLHELYFEHLRAMPRDAAAAPTFAALATERYGSLAAWEEDVRACGAMRGIGWVVTAYDAAARTIHTTWINEHDLGALAGATPLVVMDVFEHAFITVYGLDRAKYMDAFFAALDYGVVEQRLAAVHTAA